MFLSDIVIKETFTLPIVVTNWHRPWLEKLHHSSSHDTKSFGNLCGSYPSLKRLFFFFGKVLNQLDIMIFSLIASTVWHKCKPLVFGRHNFTTSNPIQWALQMVVESMDCQPFFSSMVSIPSPYFSHLLNPKDPCHWSAPPYDSFKLNYDAPVLNGDMAYWSHCS